MSKSAYSSKKSMELVADNPLQRRAIMTKPAPGKFIAVQWFENVNMGKQHKGLQAICEQHGIVTKNLLPGQFVVFTNVARSRLKVFAANDVLGYIRVPEGKATMEAVVMLTSAFQATGKFEANKTFDMEIRQEIDVPERAIEVASTRTPGVPRRVYIRRGAATMR